MSWIIKEQSFFIKSSEIWKLLQENEVCFQKLSKIWNEHDTKEGKGKGKGMNYYLSPSDFPFFLQL